MPKEFNMKKKIELTFFMFLRGLFKTRDWKTLNKFILDFSFDENNIPKYPITKSVLNYSNNNNNIISKITSLKLNKRSNKNKTNINEGIFFSKSFNELIDTLHFNLVNNITTILEGSPGNGKKTAINYIIKLLGINDNYIVNVYISYETKKEDLLGKYIINNENKNNKRNA